MSSIIKFFAKEHLFGNLLTVILLVVGIYSLFTIRRDIWPSVDFDITTVTTALPGASPDQIESLIINPIEDALREVDGIKKVFSTASEGIGVTIVQLDPDARDSAKTNRDVQQAVDAIDSLPKDATDPVVRERNSDLTPVIEVTVSGQGDEFQTRQAAKIMYDKLSALKGVGKVTKSGYRDLEIHVIGSPEKMSSKNISLGALINAISSNNISAPGGDTYDENNKQVLVRTESELLTVQQVENAIVKANDFGYATRIKDVATVKEELEDASITYKTNGKKSINLMVSKKSNADALDLTENLRLNVDTWAKDLPKFIEIGFSNDFSTYLRTRLKTLTSNLLMGLVLVIIILSIFLPWQVTLVVSVGIPIALLSSIAVAWMAGATLNLVSLIGLIIVLGMLVDDAIVVSENIWRHIEMGKPIQEAVITGAIEVFGPVLASILTTVSAFGPMLFMSGIFGKFIYEIPFMVIIALTFSLFEAFVIMPSHFVSWVGPFIENRFKKQALKETPNTRWYDRYVDLYQKYVGWTLRYRYGMLGLMIFIVFATGFSIVKFSRFKLFPSEGEQFFFVQAEAPKGTSFEQMAKLIEPIEAELSKYPKSEVIDYVSVVGLVQQNPNDPQSRRGPNYANIRVSLTPKHSRERDVNQLADQMRAKFSQPEKIGLKIINVDYAKEGPPQGRDISINVKGSDFTTINEIVAKIKARLTQYNEDLKSEKSVSEDAITSMRDSYIEGKDEWQVIPRPKEVSSAGLNSQLIAQTVRAAFKGLPASSIRNFDEEVDILIKQEMSPGPVVEQLSNLKIGNSIGNLIRLDSVADFSKVPTINAISHVGFKRVINISADVDDQLSTSGKVLATVNDDLSSIVKQYPGYELQFGGESEDTEESMNSLGRAFIFAAMMIFALLVVTFRNLFQPGLILVSIPLGFVGVAGAMFIHNRPFSFMALLGVIALAGVIVNNSIVLIDFVNKLREKGKDLNESIVEAAAVRMRPIVLTTATTVSGLIPTAYGSFFYETFGIGGNDPFIVPLALALGWGLGFGAILTGLFFPSFIRVNDDVNIFFRKLFRMHT